MNDLFTTEELESFVKAHKDAEKTAKESLGKGKKFIGAYGVAEKLGYEKGTTEYKIAVSTAYNVFKYATIVIGKDNIQI